MPRSTTNRQNNTPPEPPRQCGLCPRLAEFRQKNATENPQWFNGAVPSFGTPDARLLIMGLAPGLQGANRTGRPFTGDYAGDLLYQTMIKYGFADGTYEARSDDGLRLNNAMISNAVRCVPPQNKPIAAEINACREFLQARIAHLPALEIIIALGKIAHDSVLRAFGAPLSRNSFGHGNRHDLSWQTASELRRVTLLDSYHCSRYNTNTGRLTQDMFEAVFSDAATLLAKNPAA